MKNEDIIYVLNRIKDLTPEIKKALQIRPRVSGIADLGSVWFNLYGDETISVYYQGEGFQLDMDDLECKFSDTSYNLICYEYNNSVLIHNPKISKVTIDTPIDYYNDIIKTYNTSCSTEELFRLSLELNNAEYKMFSLLKELKESRYSKKFVINLEDVNNFNREHFDKLMCEVLNV